MKKIFCKKCNAFIGELATGSIWDKNSVSICGKCAGNKSTPSDDVEMLSKLFGFNK